MKTVSLFLLFILCIHHTKAQRNAGEFMSILRSGNSEKAFGFVRDQYGIPINNDPFLHFKQRGIEQLISFYNHMDKRIEATSLIRFEQTRQFWKNYSQQF